MRTPSYSCWEPKPRWSRRDYYHYQGERGATARPISLTIYNHRGSMYSSTDRGGVAGGHGREDAESGDGSVVGS